MMSWISALALAAAPQGAQPPSADHADPTDWARRPTVRDLARFYPDRAQREEVSGDVTLACSVDRSGALSQCGVSAETPAGYGFGDAALKLAETYWMRPDRAERWAAAERRVLLPVVFRLPPGTRANPPRTAPGASPEWVPRGDLRRRLPRGERT